MLIRVSIKKQTVQKHELINIVNIKEAGAITLQPLSMEENHST
ncbi:UNVERIFIED_ORG: hypothetical protein FHU01_4049 [Citrobacter freundii]|jgi:hypothetical protein